MKLTRRNLVLTAAGSALALQAQAQPAAPAAGGRDFGKEARDGMQRSADALAKFQVAMSTEPAFRFKA